MNELQIFNNEKFGEIRAVEIENEPWFVAKDICDCLDLKNTTVAINRLDGDERSKFNLGRQGETNCVNEYGLYSLILSSRKKEAKEFKRWVTHDVIPSIRKTGGYIAGQEELSDEELMAKALMVAKRQIDERDKKIEVLQPKALFADAVSTSKTSILIGDLAKLLKQNGIDMGQKRLFEWMRDNGYLIKQKGTSYNMPSQRSMEMELFEVKESSFVSPDGHTGVSRTTKVTGKGQIYFINKFLAERKETKND